MQIKPSPIDIEATMGAVNAAMEFVSYAHRRGHPYTGTVFFSISDPSTNTTLQKSVKVSPTQVEVVEGKDNSTICSVTVNKDILFSVIAGQLDPMIAFMCGQILIDNPIGLAEFAQAFELTPQKLDEFKNFLESRSRAPQASNPTVETTSETPPAAIPTVATTTITTPNQSNSDTYKPLSSIIAQTLLTGIYKAYNDTEKAMTNLRNDPRYQTVTAKVTEIASSEAVQKNSAIKFLTETFQKEYKAQRVDETINETKQIAQIFINQMLNYLIKESQKQGVDRSGKKAQLESQLEALKEQNRKNEEERKNRVNKALKQ